MIADILIRIAADFTLIGVVLIGGAALLWYVPSGQRLKAYSRVLMAGLTALLLAKIIASLWQPTDVRPFIEQGVKAGAAYINNPGFPSDHALFAAAITLAVFFETKQKMIVLILVLATCTMGVGRILALVHTPLDILGGFVFALIGALWYVTVPARRPIDRSFVLEGRH